MAKEKPKETIVERTYTIPLRKAWLKAPRYKRAKKAVKTIKVFLARHMKVSERDISKVKLDPWLNRAIWLRSIKKPPHKIVVKVTKEQGIVKAEFVGLPPKYKVQEAFLLRKKIKLEAKVKEKAEGKKKIEEKKPEIKKEEKPVEEKSEEEKIEEKEKKEKEKILHKEIAKPEHPYAFTKAADGKREKKEMRRKALEK